LPNVTDQKNIFLKGKLFRKRMVCNFSADNISIEKSHETAKKANEFCDANQILKKPDFWNLASKKPIWQPCKEA
jgi:hypothetical protein